MPFRTALLTAVLLGAACVAPARRSADAQADYTLVFLNAAADRLPLTVDEVGLAMRGHFENMERLAQEGLLLVAGPLGEPRARPEHRGIFVFDLPEGDEALRVAATDPAVRAGIFTLEAFPLRATVALREVVERDAALQEERLAREPGGPEWIGRPYVLVTAPDAERAERALAPLLREGRVLMPGRLGGAHAGVELLFALDAESAEAARDLLARASADPPIEWTLLPWYASPALAELAPGRE